mmetsp:Transcript_8568/g.18438  ORF Transcript_8568/g.18438 Transcript_8568/m.18438 type:complete len:95 (-) Transcript_8568:455-739(-)
MRSQRGGRKTLLLRTCIALRKKSPVQCYPYWSVVPARPVYSSSYWAGTIDGLGDRGLCGADRIPRAELSSAFDTIVKVFIVSASPNWFIPWQTK